MDAVERGPQPYALPTTAGRQVAREPSREAGIPYDDRVAIVGAMPGAQGRTARAAGADERCPVIGGIGDRRVAAARGSARVVVIDDNGAAVAPHEGLTLSDIRVDAVRGRDHVGIGAAKRGSQNCVG